MNDYDKALFEAGEELIAAIKELNKEIRKFSTAQQEVVKVLEQVVVSVSDSTADHRD